MSLHWSKTRHIEYTECPRRFYYGAVAAPRNERLAALRDQVAGPLIRHEGVRTTVSEILREGREKDVEKIVEAGLSRTYDELLREIGDYAAERQQPIVEASVRGFVDDVWPQLQDLDQLFVGSGQPEEFTYGGLPMMASVEAVYGRDDYIWVLSWRTGKSAFFSQSDANWKCAAETYWVRSSLRITDRRVIHTDLYLAEGALRKDTELDDRELAQHLDDARRTSEAYSRSAKIRDFPAYPSQGNCRFCNYSSICPEFLEFSEPDFSPAGLEAAIVAEPAAPEYGERARMVFLSHCSEDKNDIVRPFARALEADGISYWLDEAEILWGDSLSQSINRGLRDADLVVCFLSEAFLERGWPEAELGAGLSRELGGQGGRVLPLIVAEFERVVEAYPLLADKRCEMWGAGIPELVMSLKAVLKRTDAEDG